jgi:hypothetical protein
MRWTSCGMRERLRRAGFAGAAVAFVILIVVLGWANPPVRPVISTDRLGPDSGEPVADYLTRARESLSGTDGAERWALVSFSAGITPDRIPESVPGLRVSNVIYDVPIARVYTPPITVPVPAGDAAAIASVRAAAGALDNTETSDDRTHRVAALMATRLHAGCACAVDLVVRGRLDQLRALIARPDVRSVQALPPDAVADAFAVVPLLPEQTSLAVPGPDDGPVPDH